MSVIRLTVVLVGAMLALLAMSVPASAQSRFVLSGSAREDVDPDDGQTPVNEVVSIDNTSTFGAITRNYGSNTSVEVKDFDNQLEVKYFLQSGKTCILGSPRFQLSIDADGTGGPEPRRNAFGYLGDRAFGGLCQSGKWVYEDMTNDQPKWDVSQIANQPGAPAPPGNAMTLTWQQMETYFQTSFPNHFVGSASLVEDPASGPGTGGCTWYDLMSVRFDTMHTHDDTAGTAGTCTPSSSTTALGGLLP